MKLPLSPGKNDGSVFRKLFGKEKEKLDTWEVLDEGNYPDDPGRSQNLSVGVRPPVSARTKQLPPGGAMPEPQSLTSSQTRSISLRDKKGPSGALLDRKIWPTPASTSTVSSSSIAGADSPDRKSVV